MINSGLNKKRCKRKNPRFSSEGEKNHRSVAREASPEPRKKLSTSGKRDEVAGREKKWKEGRSGREYSEKTEESSWIRESPGNPHNWGGNLEWKKENSLGRGSRTTLTE